MENPKKPLIHLTPLSGWMNDPNGLILYDGVYHAFYQHNPNSVEWGNMHWGHAVSIDGLDWKHLIPALAPDAPFDALGCYSGSALAHGGKLYLMYTGCSGVEGKPETLKQQQCLACSEDGVEFKKFAAPVIPSDLVPPEFDPSEFRDPKLIKRGKAFYCMVGSKRKEGGGVILLYKSLNLLNWQFAGVCLDKPLGSVLECPDLLKLEDRELLLASPQFKAQEGNKYLNVHSSMYFSGYMDYKRGKFFYEKSDILDYGFDYYAAQAFADSKTPIIMAWMNMWGRNNPHAELGWAGQLTLPREVEFIGGKLVQYPIAAIKNYRASRFKKSGLKLSGLFTDSKFSGDCCEILLKARLKKAGKFEVRVFSGGGNYTAIRWENGKLLLDRTYTGVNFGFAREESAAPYVRVADHPAKTLELRIILDRYSVEVFADSGRIVMSAGALPPENGRGIELYAEGTAKISKLIKYDLAVPAKNDLSKYLK